MTAEDAQLVGELAIARGRNAGAQDYRRFFALEGASGLVLTREGSILGAATVMRYFDHAFLGPVILREDADGLAIALLAKLIESMQRDGVGVIEAEAGAFEEAILSRMGFQVLRATIVLERAPGGLADRAGSAPMDERHILDVGALDADAVGYGRKEYIMALRAEHPNGARVVEREGEVAGYVLVRRTPRGAALGPLVTRPGARDEARALLRDALSEVAGERVVALVPDGSALLPDLEREGFQRVGALARMRAGERDEALSATEWAIGGRITG